MSNNFERFAAEGHRDPREVVIILYDALTEYIQTLKSFLNSRDIDGSYEFDDPNGRVEIAADITAAEGLRKKVEDWGSTQLSAWMRRRWR
jgi:hypothetical protein